MGDEDQQKLAAKIKDWLSGQGYPLEMRVARRFREQRFDPVVLGDFYPTAEKWREIDVVAQRALAFKSSKPNQPPTSFDFLVVCECKSGARKRRPWVVFSDEVATPPPHYRMMWYPATDLGVRLLWKLREDHEVHGCGLFREGRVGYAAAVALTSDANADTETTKKDTRAASSGPDTAFSALASVLSAAKAKASIEDETWGIARVVIPVVVVSSALFECTSDPGGSDAIHVEPRDEMLVHWRNPGVGPGDPTLVHIVHERALSTFAERISQTFEFIHTKYDELIRNQIHSLPFVHRR